MENPRSRHGSIPHAGKDGDARLRRAAPEAGPVIAGRRISGPERSLKKDCLGSNSVHASLFSPRHDFTPTHPDRHHRRRGFFGPGDGEGPGRTMPPAPFRRASDRGETRKPRRRRVEARGRDVALRRLLRSRDRPHGAAGTAKLRHADRSLRCEREGHGEFVSRRRRARHQAGGVDLERRLCAAPSRGGQIPDRRPFLLLRRECTR